MKNPSGHTAHLYRLFKKNPKLCQGNLQIIACAGSGKTEFVSARIAFLIAERIATPEHIVAFTFTEKAAKELKFRIRTKIRERVGRQPDIGDLYIGTIHSFCFELLKEFVPGYRGYDVLDEGKRYAFVSAIRRDLKTDDLLSWLQEHDAKPFGSTKEHWVINTFIRNVDIVREEMLAPSDVSLCPEFVQAYETYNHILHQRRFLDFSSMMALAVHHLSTDKNTLKAVRARYTHITVDEYQDINPIQEKLIQLLAGKNGNLCVVGDDDQSIYQWRGATVENILTFQKRYKNVYTHHLPINYRSTDNIIQLANNLILKNKKRLQKSMAPSNKPSQKGDIYKIAFEHQKDEIDFIVKRITHLIGTRWEDNNGQERGLAYSDMAIFFRSVKYDSQPYLEALQHAGIPYAVSGVGGLFKTPEIEVVFSIFSYLGDFEKNYDSGVMQEHAICHQASSVFTLSHPKQFMLGLHELKEQIAHKPRLSLQELYADILILLGIDQEDRHDLVHEVEMYNLGRFSQVISDYEGTRTYCTYKDINRFCWFIKHYAENAYDAGTGEDPTLFINAVQVITLHGTKGLGFPVVFMPYCVERAHRQTPPGFLNSASFNFTRYQGSEEDERRLFYVGITRAKQFLYITTSRNIMGKKRLKSPVKFFKELDPTYCMTTASADPTKRQKLPSQPSAADFHFPTSYSQISDYIRCEYDYKMRYIYNFNPVIVQALGYGKQVHNILNLLHRLIQDGIVPTPETAAQVLKNHFYLRYAADKHEDALRKSALKSILRYLDLWQEDFSLSVKTERHFEMDIENALLSGSIDLLKRKNEKENILEIIDFKTGNEKRANEELMLQVQLYTIAGREALNLAVDKAYVHFLDGKKQARLEILTTPKQLELAMNTVKDAINGITARRFHRNPKTHQTCHTCDWERLCPKKKKT